MDVGAGNLVVSRQIVTVRMPRCRGCKNNVLARQFVRADLAVDHVDRAILADAACPVRKIDAKLRRRAPRFARQNSRETRQQLSFGKVHQRDVPDLPELIFPCDAGAFGAIAERGVRKNGNELIGAGHRSRGNGEHSPVTHVAHCPAYFFQASVVVGALIIEIDEKALRIGAIDGAYQAGMIVPREFAIAGFGQSSIIDADHHDVARYIAIGDAACRHRDKTIGQFAKTADPYDDAEQERQRKSSPADDQTFDRNGHARLQQLPVASSVRWLSSR